MYCQQKSSLTWIVTFKHMILDEKVAITKGMSAPE